MNMIYRFRTIIPFFISIITLGISLYFIQYLYHLGQLRGFNLDEFAYLNWGYHIKAGYVPYRDFLMFTTPLYSVVLSLLFWIRDGIEPVLMARAFGTVLYVGLGFLTVYLFYSIRKSWTALLILPLFLAIPQPSENIMEIRPDIMGTCLAIAGVIFQIHWMKKNRDRMILLSGFWYALSTLTLQKTAPFFFIGFIFLIIHNNVIKSASQGVALRSRKYFEAIIQFFIGFWMSWVLFGLWSLQTGNPGKVWYSITTMVFEANKISTSYWNLPFYYFSKNPFYFGSGNIGWQVNTVLWIGAVAIGGAFIISSLNRFLWELRNHKRLTIKKEDCIELFIGMLFFSQLILYIFWTPLKHPQYLIPIIPFIAYYWGELLLWIWKKTERKGILGSFGYLGGITIIGIILFVAFHSVNAPKFGRDNGGQIAQMNQIWKFIPKDTYVLDLEGRTIYYPYPYYACCVVFMEFGKYLSVPLPSLKESLEQYKPSYIYQEKFNKIGAMSKEEQDYIYAHYVSEWGGELWRRK